MSGVLLVFGMTLAQASAPTAKLVPPKVVDAPPAVYPEGRAEAAEVDLRIEIDPTGNVAKIEILKSGGAPFDIAARAAVAKWKFEPAMLDGVPFAANIRIPFIFKPPEGAEPAPDAGTANGGEVAADAGSADGGESTDAGGAASSFDTLAAQATQDERDHSKPLALSSPQSGRIEGPDAGAPPAPLPEVLPVAAPAAPPEAAAATSAPEEVRVRGAPKKVDRGGSDFQITVGQQAINVQSPKDLLELAPGVFIANEGGAGHADQVFLRGFDAQTGAGIEFTFNGVPINEVDNTDGHGYADTHFIIPEVVRQLRVVEGPFDPHQGDFAEAGSVDYDLGVTDRRLQISAEYGSFASKRVLALWAPQGEREGTFGAVQAETSAGYGQNRASTDASAIAQYEGELGQRGLWRALLTAYATQYQSAGVVRSDDVASGAINFYGTEDASQGGSAQRYTASFSLENPVANGGLYTLQFFLTYRTLVLDEDFTGFLLDPIGPGQTPHGERGDGILQNYEAITAGSRGAYKLTRHWFGEDQSIEIGYYARYDHTTPSIDRVRFGTQIPYAVDEDLTTDVFNLAGYVDLDIHIGKKLTLRGGVRQEYFNYNINNLCAGGGNFINGANVTEGELPNVACPTFDSTGVRLANQPIIAAGLITEPKATVLYQIVPSLAATASFGIGASSFDATQISQDEETPFTQITAAEGGLKYHRRLVGTDPDGRRVERADLSGRLIGYFTHTSTDLYFNPDAGRLTPTGPTERGGGVFEARLAGPWYDELASATYAYAIYDSDGTLVPYIPNLIARSDTVFFHKLPWRIADHPILAKAGLGLNYIGQRALPLGQFASPTFVMNASAKLRWSFLELGVEGQNLLNDQYPLSEFYYASFFPHGTGISYPTLAPVESFTAAPPLTIMATLSLIFDKENDR